MAVDKSCVECGQLTIASLSDYHPLCDQCRRKHGWKPWEEMTLEEKVEDLNKRIGRSDIYSTQIG
jgi:hypothetical protein